MKAIVCHVGSRHGYAVPNVFAQAGALERFYTDVCATNGFGRLARPLAHIAPLGRGALRSLAYRMPPPEVSAQTVTLDRFALSLQLRLSRSSPAESRRTWEKGFERFGAAIIEHGFGAADLLYSVMHEAGPAFAEAKKRGLRTAADVCITPSWNDLLAAEHRRFPDWGEAPVTFQDAMGAGFRPYTHMLNHAELLVCPSPFVRRDLIERFGIGPDRTALVPYAVAPHWFELETRPERGRVLFLGTADLRKGIHHFALAAQMLQSHGDSYKFVVAGGVTPSIRAKGEAMGLTFLGRVPRPQMAAELARADVVVLPSIAEGSAGATYEALAAGIPLVVSAAAGSVARDGVEGVVMDEPSAEQIAEAVGTIVANRSVRSQMGQAARERARDFTWSHFSKRLTAALSALDGGRLGSGF